MMCEFMPLKIRYSKIKFLDIVPIRVIMSLILFSTYFLTVSDRYFLKVKIFSSFSILPERDECVSFPNTSASNSEESIQTAIFFALTMF